MPTSRLTLVCQASSRATRQAMFGGGDDGMDAPGTRHARFLAGTIGAVDRGWSSPAACARQTADALGLDTAVEPALRDCDYGRWAGLSFAHVLSREPRALLRWMRDPRTAPHGGETVPALINRVGAWIDQHLRTPGHTVAVTHAAVIRAAVVHVLGADPTAFWRIDVLPLSRTDLRSNGRRWVLRALVPPPPPDGTG